MPVLDIRTYKLVPGARADFDRIFREEALPMLERLGIEVVLYGPSTADDDGYCLIRAFSSAAERDELLGAFYGSEEWQRDYAAEVSGLIEAYHAVVVELTPAIEDLQDSRLAPEES